jgi:hypothetical protein
VLAGRIILPGRLPAGQADSWPFSMQCVAALADGRELTEPVAEQRNELPARPADTTSRWNASRATCIVVRQCGGKCHS